jgi:predicted nucleotidyltransferase
MDSVGQERATTGRQAATNAAAAALKALDDLEMKGWVVGSLAKDRFGEHSDVDIVVDCSPDREYEAFRAIEKSMGDVPFDMIPFRRLADDARPFMMEGAVDASQLLARQAQT